MTNDTDKCPDWPYSLPIKDFEILSKNKIKKIQLIHEVTEDFTGITWWTLTGCFGSLSVDPFNFLYLFRLDENGTDNLIHLSHEGHRARSIFDEIQKFKRKDKEDFTLYLRLKEKYEGRVIPEKK